MVLLRNFANKPQWCPCSVWLKRKSRQKFHLSSSADVWPVVGHGPCRQPRNRDQAGGWIQSLTLLAHMLNLVQSGNDLKTVDVGFCDACGSLVSFIQLLREERARCKVLMVFGWLQENQMVKSSYQFTPIYNSFEPRVFSFWSILYLARIRGIFSPGCFTCSWPQFLCIKEN